MNVPTLAGFIDNEEHLATMSDSEVHDAIDAFLIVMANDDIYDSHKPFDNVDFVTVPTELLSRLVNIARKG